MKNIKELREQRALRDIRDREIEKRIKALESLVIAAKRADKAFQGMNNEMSKIEMMGRVRNFSTIPLWYKIILFSVAVIIMGVVIIFG